MLLYQYNKQLPYLGEPWERGWKSRKACLYHIDTADCSLSESQCKTYAKSYAVGIWSRKATNVFFVFRSSWLQSWVVHAGHIGNYRGCLSYSLVTGVWFSVEEPRGRAPRILYGKNFVYSIDTLHNSLHKESGYSIYPAWYTSKTNLLSDM